MIEATQIWGIAHNFFYIAIIINFVSLQSPHFHGRRPETTSLFWPKPRYTIRPLGGSTVLFKNIPFSRHYFSRAFLPQKETPPLVPEVPAGGRKGNAIKFQIGQDDEDDDDQERTPSRPLIITKIVNDIFFFQAKLHGLRHVKIIFVMAKFRFCPFLNVNDMLCNRVIFFHSFNWCGRMSW